MKRRFLNRLIRLLAIRKRLENIAVILRINHNVIASKSVFRLWHRLLVAVRLEKSFKYRKALMTLLQLRKNRIHRVAMKSLCITMWRLYIHRITLRIIRSWLEKVNKLCADVIHPIRDHICMLHYNLKSRQAQILLISLAFQYHQHKKISNCINIWSSRIFQIRRDRPLPLNTEYSNFTLQMIQFLFISSQNRFLFRKWRNRTFRNTDLKSKFTRVSQMTYQNLLLKCLGAMVITAGKHEHLRRSSNRIVNKRFKVLMWHAWFAWRNQFQRSVLIKSIFHFRI